MMDEQPNDGWTVNKWTHLRKSCSPHTWDHTRTWWQLWSTRLLQLFERQKVKGLDLRCGFTLWTIIQFHTGYETWKVAVYSQNYKLCSETKPPVVWIPSNSYSPCRDTISPNYHCTTSLPIPPIQLSKHLFTRQLRIIFSSLFVSVTSSTLSYWCACNLYPRLTPGFCCTEDTAKPRLLYSISRVPV